MWVLIMISFRYKTFRDLIAQNVLRFVTNIKESRNNLINIVTSFLCLEILRFHDLQGCVSDIPEVKCY